MIPPKRTVPKPTPIPVSIGLIRTPADAHLLLGRKRANATWGAGLWEAPGGKAEPTPTGMESPEQTVIREVREEFGVDYTIEDRLATLWSVTTVIGTFEMHTFVGRITGIPQALVHDQILWWTLDTIREQIPRGVFVPTFQHWFSAFQLSQQLLQR